LSETAPVSVICNRPPVPSASDPCQRIGRDFRIQIRQSRLHRPSPLHSVFRTSPMNKTHFLHRKVVSCPSCALIQFRTSSGLCRRCRQPLGHPHTRARRASIPCSDAGVSTDALTKRLGAAIRSLRRARKLSQERLAIASGTARPCLSRIERGLAIPTLSTLGKISSALGIELVDLFATIE
jgi:ribosome-binding protein aMBF1 (putative translation factor)